MEGKFEKAVSVVDRVCSVQPSVTREDFNRGDDVFCSTLQRYSVAHMCFTIINSGYCRKSSDVLCV